MSEFEVEAVPGPGMPDYDAAGTGSTVAPDHDHGLGDGVKEVPAEVVKEDE